MRVLWYTNHILLYLVLVWMNVKSPFAFNTAENMSEIEEEMRELVMLIKLGSEVLQHSLLQTINGSTPMSSSTRTAQDRVNQTRSCQSTEKPLASTDGVLLRQKSVVSTARVQDLVGRMEGCHSKGWPNLSRCCTWTLESNGVAHFCFGKKISKYWAESGKEGIASVKKLRRCKWNKTISKYPGFFLPLLTLSSWAGVDKAKWKLMKLRAIEILMMIPSFSLHTQSDLGQSLLQWSELV